MGLCVGSGVGGERGVRSPDPCIPKRREGEGSSFPSSASSACPTAATLRGGGILLEEARAGAAEVGVSGVSEAPGPSSEPCSSLRSIVDGLSGSFGHAERVNEAYGLSWLRSELPPGL